ncbi:MAG: sigma-70 family RNA polymerase sigma factor [Geminicoccaceae bacterium]
MANAGVQARLKAGEDDDVASDLVLCAQGDRSALRRIFDAESARMIGVATRILRRRELAEEAVQDCFVTIWQKAASFDPHLGSARGWLYTILRRKALNILRDGRREDLVESVDDHVGEPPVWQQAYDRLDSTSRLKRCLETLDEVKRKAVLMSFVVGYTHGEIAALLRVPLGTAKSWISRGLVALRACLS